MKSSDKKTIRSKAPISPRNSDFLGTRHRHLRPSVHTIRAHRLSAPCGCESTQEAKSLYVRLQDIIRGLRELQDTVDDVQRRITAFETELVVLATISYEFVTENELRNGDRSMGEADTSGEVYTIPQSDPDWEDVFPSAVNGISGTYILLKLCQRTETEHQQPQAPD
ncbi:hypothetical protein BV22DRAFT_1129855 [Leucogyrophana mollusca]|uniref:Uncharacterized protein n=1 Tax=Leucogyrophana mollusca TaxID=85980 RepID=A0ACB8BGN5_9AGAM|nr:hypothetical protein BV22DRAFT_1129855 [Leucogyrophana mollusca]